LWFRNDNGNNTFVDNINIWTSETHIGEIQSIASAVVYPNPFEGSASIKISALTNQNLEMRVFDSSGRMVIDRMLKVTTGETNHNIDMQKFDAGIYQLELSNGEGKISEKLIRY
jgi:hypothetical protein